MTSDINIAYPFVEQGKFTTITKGSYVDINYAGPAETVYLKQIEKAGSVYTVTWGTDSTPLVIETLTTLPEPMSVVTVTLSDSIVTYIAGELKEVLEALADGTYTPELEVAVDCTNTTSNKVMAIRVGTELISNQIQLVEGNNIQLDSTDSSLTLTALSGAGEGQHHSCEEREAVEYIGTINGQKGNNGAFLLKQKGGCYVIEGIPSDNVVTLSNQCVACCSCDDYEGLFNYLKNLLLHVQTLKTVVDAHVAELNAAITAYNAENWETEKTVEWEYQNGE